MKDIYCRRRRSGKLVAQSEAAVHTPIELAFRVRSFLRSVPRLLLVATLAWSVAWPMQTAQAAPKHTDKREIEARKAFAAGQYEQALDLYTQLYADKVHPTYLRNVGRCYQNLKQPDKAINAFRDYLRQAKDLKPAERKEIEDYIAEMEDLHKQQEAQQAAAVPAPSSPPTLPPTPPAAPDTQSTGRAELLTAQNPSEPPPPTPVYKRAWFWGVVGVAVVGAVVGGLYAAGTFSKSSIPCTAAGGCYQ
jgi:tetratricopeptide (TPR) repeat protein